MTTKTRLLILAAIVLVAAMMLACGTVAYSTDKRIIATYEARPAQMEALKAMRTAVP